MRILIADDHVMVREGLRSLLLNAHATMQVVGEASDGLEACKKSRELRPDLVLMDDSLPQLSGAEATARIITFCPKTRVLAVASSPDEAHIRQFLNAGASGYVLKKATSQQLLSAIDTVSQGEVYLDPHIESHITKNIHLLAGEALQEQLSPREVEVLTQVAWGYTNREIANRLLLSVKTIEGHKSKVGQKAGLTTRSKVMRYALQRGWINDE